MKRKSTIILILYSMGYIGISIFTQVTVKWYQYFYTPPGMNEKGLKVMIPLGIIGLAMVIARLFDGVADPLVAYYSDKCRHKMGRRLPFILFGSLPLTITFILLWFPPVNGESILNFIYLTIMLSLFFIFFTIVVGPYLALITDLSSTRKDRILLTMMQGFSQIIGLMIAEAGSGALVANYGFRTMGIVLGIISLISIILTPLFVREDKSSQQTIQSMSLLKSLALTLQNRNFVYYLLYYNAVWFGINTLTISMPYMTEILLRRSAEDSGTMIAAAFVFAMLTTFGVPKLVMALGKKKTMMYSSVFFAVILIMMGFFGTVLSFVPSFVIVVLAGIPLAVVFVVPNAMLADIAELDGIKNGYRREGMFFGAQGLVIKIVIGLSSLVTPFLFKTFGYSAADPLGLQICGPLAGIIVLIGTSILSKYSITDEMLENSRE